MSSPSKKGRRRDLDRHAPLGGSPKQSPRPIVSPKAGSGLATSTTKDLEKGESSESATSPRDKFREKGKKASPAGAPAPATDSDRSNIGSFITGMFSPKAPAGAAPIQQA